MEHPKLLVVDDEKTIGEVFERALGKRGYQVHAVQDAGRVLKEIESDFFNIIIVDLKMPGIDGVQLLRRIKQINPYIEVIIITGYGTPQSAVSAIKLGAFDYVTKPFDIIEIEKTIKNCLERQRRAIENIELKELVAFSEVSKTITSMRNVDELLEVILVSAIQVTKARRGSLFLLNEDRDELFLKSSRGFRKDSITEGAIPFNRVASNWLAIRGQPVVVNNTEERLDFSGRENAWASFICFPMASVPLMFHGKILGVVNVCQKDTGDSFTDRDLTLLSVLASEAAIAIENARLYKQLQDKISELEDTISRLNQTQAELIQSEKLASIGRLAAGIVHEICNPLNVISGRVQLLLMDAQRDTHLADSLRIIEEYVSRTSRIANSLLKFARPNQPKISELDINQQLQETIALLEDRFTAKNIRIERDLSHSLPHVSGDKQQFQQVFLNIMLNAEQAMPEGGILKISTRELPQEHCIEIAFSDTGEGIPEENIDNIFDPFFTTKENGTGLGLSVSYGIVKMHKGTIDVQSRQGEGSTFLIKLPVIDTNQR